jgi:hypothetical protein
LRLGVAVSRERNLGPGRGLYLPVTRYLFTRIQGAGPRGVVGEVAVSDWGAEPIVEGLKALLVDREGAISGGVYGYFCLEDPTGIERGQIRLGAREAVVLER